MRRNLSNRSDDAQKGAMELKLARLLNAQLDYVEEVSQKVQRRFNKNVAKAGEMARLLDHLAENVGFAMSCPLAEDAPPQDFFESLNIIEEMDSRVREFAVNFERFASDHSAEMKRTTAQTLRKFIGWLPEEKRRLMVAAAQQLESMRSGIEAVAAEDRDLADWSVTDSDCWDD